MPLPCVPIPMKGRFSVRLRTAFFVGGIALAIASLPVAANASVVQVHPLTVQPLAACVDYNLDLLQDNSTAIKVEFVPQCSGEAAATPSIWEWVPISSSGQYIPYTVTSLTNNDVVLTYDCPGTAPDTYQVIANHEISPEYEFVSDDCGTTTEP
jgi:hypothetical protein